MTLWSQYCVPYPLVTGIGSAGAVVPNPRNGVRMSAPERNGKPGYWVSPLAIRYGHRNGDDMAVTAAI